MLWVEAPRRHLHLAVVPEPTVILRGEKKLLPTPTVLVACVEPWAAGPTTIAAATASTPSGKILFLIGGSVPSASRTAGSAGITSR